MTVTAALALLPVLVVMLMLVVVTMALTVLVMVLMLVVVAVALTVLVMMLVVVMILLKLLNSIGKRILVLHCIENISACEHIPRCRYYSCLGVALSDEGCRLLYFKLLCRIGVRQHNGGSVTNLVSEELSEILHVHFTLTCVNDGSKTAELKLRPLDVLNSLHDVGKLTYSRRLDKDSVGIILSENLSKRL